MTVHPLRLRPFLIILSTALLFVPSVTMTSCASGSTCGEFVESWNECAEAAQGLSDWCEGLTSAVEGSPMGSVGEGHCEGHSETILGCVTDAVEAGDCASDSGLGDLIDALAACGLSGVESCNLHWDEEGSSDTDQDADGDGSPEGEDCDDGDASVHPGAHEVPNDGIDQDCSGADTRTCYEDTDGDGYGTDESSTFEASCPNGYAYQNGDCDDNDPDAYPGADEITSDGVDQDCNGTDTVVCYYDLDDDGYGGDLEEIQTSGVCDGFYSDVTGDCDDNDPDVNPGEREVAGNGIDDDCDGRVDE